MLRKTAGVVGVAVLACVAVLRAEEKGAASKAPAPAAAEQSVYDFTVKDIDGKDVKLDKYKGDVMLIVNVASKCGLTPQNYKELGPLFDKYKAQGFTILAFPANNFMGQEPGSDAEIKEFCAKRNVAYPLFAKVSVKGDDQAPLYKFLTTHPNKEIAGDVEWNFQKYLVGRDGKVIAKFHPRVNPSDPKLAAAIEEALKAPKGA